MKYYLKKCGYQELGSVKNGRPQRGRYLLTSMNENILSMFPPLSTTQLNDSAIIPIIPLYSNKKVYCNLVYHNDKFHGSTASHPRNEYRLYINKALEDNQLLFSESDIIVIRTEEIKEEDDTQIVYLLDLIKNNDTSLYNKVNKIINDYPIKGGYGIYDGIINEFEERVKKINAMQEYEVEIDETITDKIITTVNENQNYNIAKLFNAASFRDFVMTGYENLCAITGNVIKYNLYTNLEAAHIQPKSHGGLYLPSNGIALCRDLHWAFDKGFFTLDDDLRVVVHPEIKSEYLNNFNKKQIRIPKNPFFIPDLKYVNYHRKNIYGSFLTTGKI